MKSLITLVLILFSSAAFAERTTSGDWNVNTSKTYSEAFVYNDAKETFGFWCDWKTCFFYVRTFNKCSKGMATSILYNSDSGSNAITGTCFPITLEGEDESYYTRMDDTALLHAISEGDTISFAIPLKGGAFKAVRFSIDGAIGAIRKVSNSKSNSNPATKPASTLL